MIDVLCSKPWYGVHLGPLVERLTGEPWEGERIRGRHDAVLVSSAHDLRRAGDLGYRRVAYLEHGIGQSYGDHLGYPGGKGRERVGLFLSPNETAAAADRAHYPRARIEVIGDPRLDTLPDREPGGRLTAAISFHWDVVWDGAFGRSALPHYRGHLQALAKGVPLLGHAHPRQADRLADLYRHLGIEFVADFDEVCRRADVYICDNSSTLYEFASTGRPVVVLNAPWFPRDQEIGLRFWKAADVGLQVDRPSDLVPTVRAALRDAPEVHAGRERALDVAYGFRAGAAARGAAIVADWLAVGARGAA